LQDLYVAEANRGGGVGRALIAAVVGAAKEAGAARVYWHTHETNAVARRVYDAVAELTGFIQYRIELLS
jgi:GNAT superfamily N-acetyltransferase